MPAGEQWPVRIRPEAGVLDSPDQSTFHCPPGSLTNSYTQDAHKTDQVPGISLRPLLQVNIFNPHDSLKDMGALRPSISQSRKPGHRFRNLAKVTELMRGRARGLSPGSQALDAWSLSTLPEGITGCL